MVLFVIDTMQTGGMSGGQATPEAVDRAIAMGIIEPEGDRFRVPSPRLLHAGVELVAAGIGLDAVQDLGEALRRDIERVAKRFVVTVGSHLIGDRPDDW